MILPRDDIHDDDDDCDCKIKYDWMVGGWGGFYLNCLNSRSGAPTPLKGIISGSS